MSEFGNFHTHSLFDDGKSSIHEMAQSAYEHGMSVLGFSGHGFNPMDACSMSEEDTLRYLEEVKNEKETWKGKMEIVCGIEQDFANVLDCTPFAYVIGSVHYLDTPQGPMPIDESPEGFDRLLEQGYNGNIRAMAEDYYRHVRRMLETREEITICGHLDLIAKYNEQEQYFPFDADWVLEAAKPAMDAGIAAGVLFEMNTGAIARGWRSDPYPHTRLLSYLAQNGARICINSDCHNARDIALDLERCAKIAKEAGFTETSIFKDGKWISIPLDDFIPVR